MERYLILAGFVVAGFVGAWIICVGGKAYDDHSQRRKNNHD